MAATEYEHETTLLELSGDISFAFRTSLFPPEPSLLLSHTSHVVGAFRTFSKGSDLQQRSLVLLGPARKKEQIIVVEEQNQNSTLQYTLATTLTTTQLVLDNGEAASPQRQTTCHHGTELCIWSNNSTTTTPWQVRRQGQPRLGDFNKPHCGVQVTRQATTISYTGSPQIARQGCTEKCQHQHHGG